MASRWGHDACVAVGVGACVRSHGGPGVLRRIGITDWAVTHRVRQPTGDAKARVACVTLRLCKGADVGLQQSCGTTSRACWRRSCMLGGSHASRGSWVS
jgi:hypothetical protein